jgi:hypothetical protein
VAKANINSLDILNKYEEIKSKVESIFTNTSFCSVENKNCLKNIINKLGKNDYIETADDFKNFTIEYLRKVLRDYTIFHYLYMEKSNDFGAMGEQRVSISFCRNLLDIPTDREVTQFDADRFRRLIDELDEKSGKKSAEALNKYLRNFVLDFFGVKISIINFEILNNYLNKLEIQEKIYATSKGITIFIFSQTKKLPIKEYEVYITLKEHARSPHYVLSIAAEGIVGNKVIIRRESCEVIFYNKWQKFYDQSKLERKRALNHKNSAIREGVKEKALLMYSAKKVEDVKNIKKLFIDEMIDGIVWHEVGHKVGEKKLDQIVKIMGNYFVNTDSIICTLKEAIADWSPAEGSLKGAFSRFIEIAKENKNKATRCIYVYLSDNWFIDEEEEFMSVQTDILTALTLYFIDKDGTVNFEKLEKEQQTIFNFIISSFNSIGNKVLNIFKTTKYQVGIHQLDYNSLEKEVEKLYKGSVNARPLEELRVFPPFWVNMFAFMKKFAPEGYQNIETVLVESANNFRVALLKNITKGEPQKYNNSLREYIYERFKEIGVLQEKQIIDYEKKVKDVCSKIKMPEKVTEKVLQKCKEVMDGKNYDISISYEGKPDPFIAVIQEMMINTGMGDIKAGMLLGELYDADEPIEKRKEYIKNELEGIRDQIESEMYLEVETLRVNKKMNIKPMVEELLGAIDFLNGKKLKDSIKEVVFEDIKNDALFEVFVPLKRGFMDWNTSQAVWRINQDLRPEEFTMQWTIDREFLEMLVQD